LVLVARSSTSARSHPDEQVGDAVVEVVVAEERPVGVSGGREAVRHADALAGEALVHLAE
jgi:hypothetical protein